MPTNPEIAAFPHEVCKELACYVYRLIDPRNGETFYIGRGQGNRVFSHIRGEMGIEGDELSNKMRRIREIRLSGLDVGHVIHRHGMEEEVAREVEAALIDAYPGLDNLIGGERSHDIGPMHASEIVSKYAAKPAVFQHPVMLISVNRSATEEGSIYEAVRYAWKVSKESAEKADYVLATRFGMIVGAFVASEWLAANSENFPGREEVPGRLGFNGDLAPQEIVDLYVGKRVPDGFRKRGAATPVMYSWNQPEAALIDS